MYFLRNYGLKSWKGITRLSPTGINKVRENTCCNDQLTCVSVREVLKEDESGSLKATVEDILFQAKRKRCSTQMQNINISLSLLYLGLILTYSLSIALQSVWESWTSSAWDGKLQFTVLHISLFFILSIYHHFSYFILIIKPHKMPPNPDAAPLCDHWLI